MLNTLATADGLYLLPILEPRPKLGHSGLPWPQPPSPPMGILILNFIVGIIAIGVVMAIRCLVTVSVSCAVFMASACDWRVAWAGKTFWMEAGAWPCLVICPSAANCDVPNAEADAVGLNIF